MNRAYLRTVICGLYAWAGEPLRIVKQNNTYFLEVADSLLGRDLLFGSRVVNLSVQKNISAGQTMSDPIVVRFVPNGKYLNMERRISNAVWDEADVAAELIARNHVIPVMQVFDLVRRDESRGVYVIDVTRYFNDEISELSPLPGE